MKTCSICGIETVPMQSHRGVADCVYFFRNYIGQQQTQIAELQRQLPPGEAAYIGPIDKDVKARLWIEGNATPQSIDRLIQTLELIKDTFPRGQDGEQIEDGLGNAWSVICPECHQPSMQVVRPGKAQCSNCG